VLLISGDMKRTRGVRGQCRVAVHILRRVQCRVVVHILKGGSASWRCMFLRGVQCRVVVHILKGRGQCKEAVHILHFKHYVRPSGVLHITYSSALGGGTPLPGGSESLSGRVAEQRNLCTWRRGNSVYR
jgi:hypothetical protein